MKVRVGWISSVTASKASLLPDNVSERRVELLLLRALRVLLLRVGKGRVRVGERVGERGEGREVWVGRGVRVCVRAGVLCAGILVLVGELMCVLLCVLLCELMVGRVCVLMRGREGGERRRAGVGLGLQTGRA